MSVQTQINSMFRIHPSAAEIKPKSKLFQVLCSIVNRKTKEEIVGFMVGVLVCDGYTKVGHDTIYLQDETLITYWVKKGVVNFIESGEVNNNLDGQYLLFKQKLSGLKDFYVDAVILESKDAVM